MPKQIRDKRSVPRGNYTYTVPATGQKFESHVFPLLVARVKAHMKANQIVVPSNIFEIIEDDYCTREPVYCNDPTAVSVDGESAFTQIVAALAIPAADALHTLGGLFGINCKACNHRHRIIKEIKKVGVSETLKRLKGTFTHA